MKDISYYYNFFHYYALKNCDIPYHSILRIYHIVLSKTKRKSNKKKKRFEKMPKINHIHSNTSLFKKFFSKSLRLPQEVKKNMAANRIEIIMELLCITSI